MKLTHLSTVLAGSGIAAATAVAERSNIFRRWDYDVCLNDCSLRGIPMPDKNTFGLPLEDFWSEQCPPIILGPYDAPIATSRVCLDFVGTNMFFNFTNTFQGYKIKSAVVTWKVKGNIASPSTWSSPPPTTNLLCDAPTGSSSEWVCKLPFASILGVPSSTSLTNLFAGMCPNTDREALGFYLQLSGIAEPASGPAIPFVQQYPCASRTNDRKCTAWKTNYPYIEVAYRCTNCHVAECPPPPSSTHSSSRIPSSSSSIPSSISSSISSSPSSPSSSPTSSLPSSITSSSTTSSSTSSSTSTSSTTSSAPPTLKTCGFGTAFGYQNPVGGQAKSYTLNTQSGAGCNRWGWYETPTVAELQGGISGPLYVGAGGNDISKAVDVGIWVATANAQGRVTVTYLLNPPYTLAEVHVNLVCLPLTKCAPGQYTYNAGSIPNLPTWSNPTPLVYPTCTGGSKAALVIHAAVNILTVVGSCPPPKAT